MQLSTAKLIEKMVRAKVGLENCKIIHKDSCPVVYDPEGCALCNCGASKTKVAINLAIWNLKIDE